MVDGYEQRAHVKLYILSTYLSLFFFFIWFNQIFFFMNILFSVGALKISFLSTLISRQSTPVRPLHGGLNRYFNYFSFFFLRGVYVEGNLMQRCKKTRDGGVFFFPRLVREKCYRFEFAYNKNYLSSVSRKV